MSNNKQHDLTGLTDEEFKFYLDTCGLADKAFKASWYRASLINGVQSYRAKFSGLSYGRNYGRLYIYDGDTGKIISYRARPKSRNWRTKGYGSPEVVNIYEPEELPKWVKQAGPYLRTRAGKIYLDDYPEIKKVLEEKGITY